MLIQTQDLINAVISRIPLAMPNLDTDENKNKSIADGFVYMHGLTMCGGTIKCESFHCDYDMVSRVLLGQFDNDIKDAWFVC